MANKKFSWRVFISISLFFSFFIIFLTGTVLYLAPAGRVAHWVNWKLIWMTKEEWQALHTVFSYLFAILSVFHLFTINWKTFWAYLKNKVSNGLNKKREFYFSTIATIVIFVAVLVQIPPFSSFMDLSTYLTESWENKEEEAPVPHAEKLTIPQLAELIDNISTEQAINRLKNNMIKVDDLSLTMQEIGEINQISPIELYKIITYKPAQDMAGTGIGKKTLEQLASENNTNVEVYLEILKKNGIEADKSETLKDLATKYDMAARDIYGLIFEE